MDDDQTAQVAREYVERCGSDGLSDLRERAEIAEALGDEFSARTWRDIAAAAERILGKLLLLLSASALLAAFA